MKETQRHRLGKLLGAHTRNLLLMSATPHNGKEADFQLFKMLLAWISIAEDKALDLRDSQRADAQAQAAKAARR